MPKSAAGKTLNLVIVLSGIGLIAFASLGLLDRYRSTHNPDPLSAATAVSAAPNGTDRPDETPIDISSDYQVPADQPRSIKLPTIGAEGFIQKVGLTASGAVGAPGNISLAGWYLLEKKPGEAGVSLIDGHVQGVYKPGIFKDLGKLGQGDKVSIQFGNRTVRHFQVVGVNSYPADEASRRMLAQEPGITHQLNLITCDGRYDSRTRQYEKRILVVTKQLEP